MIKTVKKLLIYTLSVLTFILWPINLYQKNTVLDFISYALPAILLLISYLLYSKGHKYYLLPILLIGIYEKKLLILPVLFYLAEVVTNFKKITLSFLIISLTLFISQFSAFRGQTVFNRNYEGEQLLIRNIHLYPSIPMARLFQNKPRLYLEEVSSNFFTLIDPNNYFFAGHPAPTIIQTQELYKFYWPLLIFLLIGIYYFKTIPSKDYVFNTLIVCITSLALLKNFDRNDFVLWLPISLITIHGIKKIF